MTKNQELGISFKMQEVGSVSEIRDAEGNLNATPFVLTGTEKDLERDFPGLTYSKAEGLLDVGKIKNSYTEKYSDSDRLRVHIPQVPRREATTVKFSFVIVGENRQQVYDDFYAYLAGGLRSFYDTKRKKRLIFYAPNEYKPSEEKFYGSTPYIQLDIDVQNIYGTTFDVEIE